MVITDQCGTNGVRVIDKKTLIATPNAALVPEPYLVRAMPRSTKNPEKVSDLPQKMIADHNPLNTILKVFWSNEA